MNILIDIGHPAHVHLFRNLIAKIRERHRVLVTVRNIPSARQLLDSYQIPYIDIGAKRDSLAAKLFKQIGYDLKIRRLVKKHRIELGLGSSMTLAHVSRLTRMKSIIFDDDDDTVQPLFTRFAHPFADYLLSPDALRHQRSKRKHLVYPGTHELAYLHPRRFTPDPEVLKTAGLKPKDPYFILRFNAFKAHHDLGARGLTHEQKSTLIRLLISHGRVFITSEGKIDPAFQSYHLPVSPEQIHHFIHYARMFVGDSQTMTSEAAVLGTPALKCNSFAGRLSVPNELEKKYDLCYSFLPHDFESMLIKMKELLADKKSKKEWQRRKDIMLRDKIDVTALMIWLVENYPESVRIMKEKPEIFTEFK